MQIADDFRLLTVFLFGDEFKGKEVERVPSGTGFLVNILEGDSVFVYVVTAGHVIQDCSKDSNTVYIRLNGIGGTYKEIASDRAKWARHESSDISVYALTEELEGCDVRYLPIARLATDEYVRQVDIRAGDEIFHVGMFHGHPGRARIQPVVRFGHIALMPDEKIEVDIGNAQTMLVNAYLVDAVSMGGASGAPVFVFFPDDRRDGSVMNLIRHHSHGSFDALPPEQPVTESAKLLGVIQGYYEREIFDAKNRHLIINQGIGVVIPASAIVELLTMNQSLKKQRDEAIRTASMKKSIKPVRASVGESDQTYTRDDFMGDLNKVVRRRSDNDAPKSDEGNSQT